MGDGKERFIIYHLISMACVLFAQSRSQFHMCEAR